ncbi:hypothetical protein DPMN_166860 [Dreissena polymorpha]|uniref:Uncharacterized protein n=1 Tax=Dreissena polymorpha TaxID=45954 RepID=A0A9D4EYR6_DREPO|nr:hypothetical protein DPMN_166860 [Dreissena polymorpha]
MYVPLWSAVTSGLVVNVIPRDYAFHSARPRFANGEDQTLIERSPQQVKHAPAFLVIWQES